MNSNHKVFSSNRRVTAGIDPGKKGGIAVLYEDGTDVFPYSDEGLIDLCRSYANIGGMSKSPAGLPKSPAGIFVCLEKVHSMPGQGVASTFAFGKGYGYICGVLEAFGIPYQEIPPQKWKREYSLGSNKKQSIETARKLFPGLSLKASERCTSDHDGMAEALLIALYGKRHF